MEVQRPGVGFVRVSRAAELITLARPSKFSTHRAEQALYRTMIIRTENHPDGWLLEQVGGVRHSPMSALGEGPHPLEGSGVGLQDVLAVPLMELVKVLELGGLEREIVGSERDTGAHDHDLGLEVLHHVSEEIVSH